MTGVASNKMIPVNRLQKPMENKEGVSSSTGLEHTEKKVEKIKYVLFVNIFSNSCTQGIYYKNIQACYSCYSVIVSYEVPQAENCLTYTTPGNYIQKHYSILLQYKRNV